MIFGLIFGGFGAPDPNFNTNEQKNEQIYWEMMNSLAYLVIMLNWCIFK